MRKQAGHTSKKLNEFPSGWDEERVQAAIRHYEGQTEEEAIAEDEAMLERAGFTVMDVPSDLVPKVRSLIGKRKRTA